MLYRKAQMKPLAIDIIKLWGFIPSLRVSVTGICNLNCAFCHNEGNKRSPGKLTIADYRNLAEAAARIGITSVKLTGGEPTMRNDLMNIVAAFHMAGFSDISLISNGVYLDHELQVGLHAAGLDRVSISLPTLKPGLYAEMFNTDPRVLDVVLRNISTLPSIFPSVKLNCVFIEGKNFPDEVIPLVKFVSSVRITLSVLSVLRAATANKKQISEAFREIVERAFGIVRVRHFEKRGAEAWELQLSNGASIEIDDFRSDKAVYFKNTNPYCQGCPRRDDCTEGPYAFRIKLDGTFKPCLVRNDNEVPFQRAFAA